jgi:hypothetical protein
MMTFIIEPALKEFGLRVVRADQMGKPGLIGKQVIEHILKARLVIADLSFHTRMSSMNSATAYDATGDRSGHSGCVIASTSSLRRLHPPSHFIRKVQQKCHLIPWMFFAGHQR